MKTRGGQGFLTGGKEESRPETEPIFLAGENWRVFEITILTIRQAFHHGFENASPVERLREITVFLVVLR